MSLIYDEQLSNEDKKVVKGWWKDCYDDIRKHGYALPTEFIPSHTPSRPPPNQRSFNDIARPGILISVLARREEDGFRVMLTWVPPGFKPRIPEPHNHCAPCLHLFVLENSRGGTHSIVVTPWLHPFDKRQFKTFPDFIDFFDEICKGIQFMHERNIAYRACTTKNIVWTDPPLVHPDDGTEHPYRYYFLDFGFSRQYKTRGEMGDQPRGRDNFALEHELGVRTDIYNVGLLVREKFLDKFQGFGPMRDLVKDMTFPDPWGRPLIEEVVSTFDPIKQRLGVDSDGLRPLRSSWWRSLFWA
ncbi:hypothetical protein BJV78DRAFT_1206787 [Lactifluus subvellereus]|nr:hypothetical protein BJV78DRAFT_1206787 [Lactifluus subvellereus]